MKFMGGFDNGVVYERVGLKEKLRSNQIIGIEFFINEFNFIFDGVGIIDLKVLSSVGIYIKFF